MSWDASLLCDTCGHETADVNYTHNTNPMINAALAPAVQWATLADLRGRDDLERIECQNVTSGRWWPAWDARWDGCVIQVPWRLTAADGTTPTQPDEVLWPLIARVYEQFRDQPTAMQLGRLAEEVGEVWQAYAGVMSANPRKGGATHCPAEVTQELWDVIVTAMVSLHHFADDPAAAAHDYLEKYEHRLADAERVVGMRDRCRDAGRGYTWRVSG